MVDQRVRSVGGYVLRLVGGVAVILGILGVFTALSQSNLVGIGISIAFIAGGYFLFRSSKNMMRREAPSVR